ncbi:MAG: cytochrome c [Nitrospirae bacterium]|nr:cytochrome c [Nitrospirota bacterium]
MECNGRYTYAVSFMAGICFMLIAGVTNFPRSASGETGENEGKTLYKRYCAACHPNPNRLRDVKNIIERIRNPISSMPGFSTEKLSNPDAAKIQIYIHRDKKTI